MSSRGPLAIVVMGVSGSGKSTIGSALAERIEAPFVDADDLHSEDARAKMSAGVPLDDADRMPWLDRVAARMAVEARAAGKTIVACSALTRRYRDALRSAPDTEVVFVHLESSAEVLDERMRGRAHFMPASLLSSQLATLEPLHDDEAGGAVTSALTVEAAVIQALEIVARERIGPAAAID